MKLNNFRGELTDISTIQEALVVRCIRETLCTLRDMQRLINTSRDFKPNFVDVFWSITTSNFLNAGIIGGSILETNIIINNTQLKSTLSPRHDTYT